MSAKSALSAQTPVTLKLPQEDYKHHVCNGHALPNGILAIN